MTCEIDALEESETWDLGTPPKKKAIRYKWMYKLKFNTNITVERYKSQDCVPRQSSGERRRL